MPKTLLPTGCYDVLPPQARQEFKLSAALMAVFESFGYEQVAPPLLEYSENLLAGRGASLSAQIFRVMDAQANKVMGIRGDMTLQISRIAASRLSHAPRPLRLCYNGPILRTQGEQLKGDRQLHQAGIELIGSATPEADAEVILVAAEALAATGIEALSIDLNLPGITAALLASERLDNEQLQKLLAAVAHKDVSAIAGMAFAYRDTLIELLRCAGPAHSALAAISRLDLPENAKSQLRDLQEVVRVLEARGSKGWTLTVDATENRGLDYYSGLSFSMFVPGAACEVGRGGRYRVEGAVADTEATGFTLYVETLRSLLPAPQSRRRLFVSEGIEAEGVAAFRAEGFVTVHGLSEYGSGEDEARRLGCDFMLVDGKVRLLT